MEKRRTVLTSLPVHPGVPEGDGPHHLHVGGLVQGEVNLTREHLSRLPQAEHLEDFVCKEGWTVPSQQWGGVLVADLLDLAGARDGARFVEFAAGEFRFTVTIDEARAAIVALTLNGEPLPPEHGGPARLVMPGADCFTSVKWLDRIELTDRTGPNVAREVAMRRLSN